MPAAYGGPPGAQPPFVPLGGPGIVTDQRPTSAAVVVIAWILAFLTLGYLIPWAVAASRGKSNQGAIALINLFLGWTFVGWVVALVMACTAHQTVSFGQPIVVAQHFAPAPVAPTPPAGWYPSPDGIGQRYWDGGAWTVHTAP